MCNAVCAKSLFKQALRTKKNLAPIHPGEILLEEFMKPMSISQYKLAKELHVGAIRISEIIHGKRSITADTAN